MDKVKIIAEIGINHNGDIETAKRLIDLAILSGCDYAKFQKRNPDVCVPESQKSKMRMTPWGEMQYIDYKHKIEFDYDQYLELFDYVTDKPIQIFASVWDKDSVDFMSQFTRIMKIGSASITDLELCKYARDNCDFLIISTGMSTEKEIWDCVEHCKPDVIMHTNSTYPSPIDELNLSYIKHLINCWSDWDGKKCSIGYSGHEFGLATTFAAVALGATWIERHITLDREMWGSDQKSSVEPVGLFKLVKGIRDIEKAMGTMSARKCLKSELAKRESLRKT